jgi:hypothetical protein
MDTRPAYPGGMTRGLRNKLWFAEHSQQVPAVILNRFVDWVGETKPVRDPMFSRRLDVSALWNEFALVLNPELCRVTGDS